MTLSLWIKCVNLHSTSRTSWTCSIKMSRNDVGTFHYRFNYRSTHHLVTHGFYNFLNWFDERAWYPLGRIVGGTVSTYLSLISLINITYTLLRLLYIQLSSHFFAVSLSIEKSGKRVHDWENSAMAKRERKTTNSNLQTFIILIWCFHSRYSPSMGVETENDKKVKQWNHEY